MPVTQWTAGVWEAPLIAGPLPTAISWVGAMAGALLVAGRDRRWWVRLVPIAIACGAAFAAACGVLVAVAHPFPDLLPVRMLSWLAVFGAACGLLVVGWRRVRWWRRVLGLTPPVLGRDGDLSGPGQRLLRLPPHPRRGVRGPGGRPGRPSPGAPVDHRAAAALLVRELARPAGHARCRACGRGSPLVPPGSTCRPPTWPAPAPDCPSSCWSPASPAAPRTGSWQANSLP